MDILQWAFDEKKYGPAERKWRKKMASMKAKKGNPFEYNVAYSIMQGEDLEVRRIDDNTAGVDLVVDDKNRDYHAYVECKHHKGFSWNELEKIFLKTEKESKKRRYTPLLIFKANRQPVCIMYRILYSEVLSVCKFEDYWGVPFKKRPKGYKIWQN